MMCLKMDKEQKFKELLDDIEFYCVFVYKIDNKSIKAVVYGEQDSFKDVWEEACNYMDELENHSSGDFALTFSDWYASAALKIREDTEFVNINEK